MSQGRRRIDFLAPPFSGHLNPVMGMARMLAAHYDVRVLSTPGAVARIRAAGLQEVALMEGADSLLDSIANPPHAVKSNPLRMHRQFRQAVQLLSSLSVEITELYRRDPPDLLVADFTLPTGGFAARKLGIPWWTSLPSPCVMESPDGPPAYFGGLSMAEGAVDRLTQAAARKLVRLFKLALFGLYRGTLQQAGLSSPYRADGTEAVYSPDCVLALGLPELEFPRQWPAAVRFVRPILYTPPMESVSPEFRSGHRHVLVSLGTHLGWHKNEMSSRIRELASRFPDVMFHFSDGTLQGNAPVLEGNFQRLPFVDYERWLSRYDLVIHHGGAGIMYYCIAHAKPALVYPLDYDQFDHAARLVRAGLAVRVRGLAELEDLLRRALADMQMVRACERFRALFTNTVSDMRLLRLVRQHLGNSEPV